jgi:hypothetical protein
MKYTVIWFDYDKEDTEITTEEAEDDLQIFMDVFDHPNDEKGLSVILIKDEDGNVVQIEQGYDNLMKLKEKHTPLSDLEKSHLGH